MILMQFITVKAVTTEYIVYIKIAPCFPGD
jgi:hypothetical protein